MDTTSKLNSDVEQSPADRQKKELISIQYLRGLAAIMVITCHISLKVLLLGKFPQLSSIQTGANILFYSMQSGVDIFFIISGFIMIYSNSHPAKSNPVSFLIKRIIRIVPLYWTATIAMIIVAIFMPQFISSTKVSWPYALSSMVFVAYETPGYPGTYGTMVAPGWTLILEMMFYCLFTAGLATGQSGWRLVTVVASPVVLLSLIGAIAKPQGIASFYTNPIMLEFVFGMILGRLFISRHIVISNIVGITIMLTSLISLIMIPVREISLRWLCFGIPAFLIVASSLCIRPYRFRLPLIIGDASYSIYISHFFVVSVLAQVWTKLGLNSPSATFWLYPVGISLCCVVGVACWHFVEIPLTKNARQLLMPSRARALSAWVESPKR